MSDSNHSVVLKGHIELANTGDLEARRKLLEHAYDRLCQLAGKMLAESFPTLKNRHEVNSIVHETWLKLDQALDKSQPPTVADFFRLAAFKIRQVLLDLVERHRKASQREQFGLGQGMGSGEDPAHGNTTNDPRKLAEWTEFHQRADRLDADEGSVFELHYYLDISQTEIAELLNLHPLGVSSGSAYHNQRSICHWGQPHFQITYWVNKSVVVEWGSSTKPSIVDWVARSV